MNWLRDRFANLDTPDNRAADEARAQVVRVERQTTEALELQARRATAETEIARSRAERLATRDAAAERRKDKARERAERERCLRLLNEGLHAATYNRYWHDGTEAIEHMCAMARYSFALGEPIAHGQGRYTWMLARDGEPLDRGLHVSLYKMPSGNWEVTAYAA